MNSFMFLQHYLSEEVAGAPLDMILGGPVAYYHVVGRQSLPVF